MMKKAILPVGKLRHDILGRLLSYTARSSSIIVPPAIGEDAAVIDWGKRYLVIATDPVTFTSQRTGWYSVCINANDIAACGGTPIYYTLALILPEKGVTEDVVEEIFKDTQNACEGFDILWVGGHTEISRSVKIPLLVGQMIGEVTPERLCRTSDAVVGDRIILTKAAGIEGTSIIASEKAEGVVERYGESFLERCRGFLHDPGISILREATVVSSHRIHAMHDPTEGGVAVGLREICLASDCGAILYEDQIPIMKETRILCDEFGISPLGLISSGSLMLTASEDEVEGVLSHLRAEGIPAATIGEITEKKEGLKMRRKDGKVTTLPDFQADELTKL